MEAYGFVRCWEFHIVPTERPTIVGEISANFLLVEGAT
jgi:hypothetical protein